MAAKPKAKSKPKKASSAPEWGVHTLRLTAFSSDSITLDQVIWDRVAKFQPTNVRSVPAVIMSGRSDDGLLSMRVTGPKIDIVLQPRLEPGEQPNPVGSMGALNVAFPVFRNFVSRYFATKPKLVRVAFGLIQHSAVTSASASLETILSHLHDLKLKKTTDLSDLFFQINRPRSTKILGEKGDTKINRLSKWSSIQVFPALIQIGSPDLKLMNSAPEFYARMELDVNTAAERTKLLPPKKLLALFDELHKQAEEITRKGDVP